MSEVDKNEPEVDNPAQAVDNPESKGKYIEMGPFLAAPQPIDPLATMRAMMAELLLPLQTQIKELASENTRLREEAIKNAESNFADNVPSHLRSDDRLVDPSRMSKARSVTIRTRPVVENPDDYKNVVDAGGLVHNTMEKIAGPIEEREDA